MTSLLVAAGISLGVALVNVPLAMWRHHQERRKDREAWAEIELVWQSAPDAAAGIYARTEDGTWVPLTVTESLNPPEETA